MGRAVSTMKCPMLLSSENTKSLPLSCVKNFLRGMSICRSLGHVRSSRSPCLGSIPVLRDWRVTADAGLGAPFPSPRKEPGGAGRDPGRSALHRLHPQGAGAGSPPPRRPQWPSAGLPAAASLVPGAPAAQHVLLTSARAGSGPCTAAGCSCWAGACGSLFRWLRSSSGTARTPVGAHRSASSRSRGSRGADARPLPRAADAAAIPAAETATHGRRRRKCGRREASTPSRARRASLTPRRRRCRLVRSRHHAGSGKGGRKA